MTFEEYFEAKYGSAPSHLKLVYKAIAEDAWDAAMTPRGCAKGDWCVCGGDLPSVREGCASWRSVAYEPK